MTATVNPILDIIVIIQSSVCLIAFLVSFYWIWNLYIQFSKEYEQFRETMTSQVPSSEGGATERATSIEDSTTQNQEESEQKRVSQQIADTPMTRRVRRSVRNKVDIFDEIFNAEAFELVTQEQAEFRRRTISSRLESIESIENATNESHREPNKLL